MLMAVGLHTSFRTILYRVERKRRGMPMPIPIKPLIPSGTIGTLTLCLTVFALPTQLLPNRAKIHPLKPDIYAKQVLAPIFSLTTNVLLGFSGLNLAPY